MPAKMKNITVLVTLPENITNDSIFRALKYQAIYKLGTEHFEKGGIHEVRGWMYCKCELAETIRKLDTLRA